MKTRMILLMTALFIGLLVTAGFAGEEWNMQGDINLTATQNVYSDNWAGSETGSASWTFNLNFLAEKQLSEIINDRNSVKLAFGQTYTQNSETDEWSSPQTSTDLIDLESLFRFIMDKYVDPFASMRFESQFYGATGEGGESSFLNPSTLTESAGLAKSHVKTEKTEWLSRLGFSMKEHFMDDVTNTDGGFEFTSEFTGPVAGDKLTLTSKLTLYKALFYSESDDDGDAWKATDVDWENILAAQISSYVTVNLYMQLLYDKQIVDEMRFKQTLALGLTYKFI